MISKENNFAFIDNTNVHKGIQMLGWKYEKAVIVTGDGDFQCLVKHLRKVGKLGYVVSPNRKWCSILLKREARQNHVFIEEMKSKLELK